MSGEGGDFSVYGEAKGEYTRQLCVFLVPTLETYVLELLAAAKEEAPTANKVLWQFQTVLQGIPDWNQDKVIRETEKLQKDCPCDYLEELITAVFIAHTKVLSAIRLTTKQKKLQITIPKIDHFLHRVLSECARTLWTNAYLFADSNSIEKQKNLRQVSSLLNDSVLQAIRALLPVKSILREYLHDDDDEETESGAASASASAEPEVVAVAAASEPVNAPVAETAPETAPENAPVNAPETTPVTAPETTPVNAPETTPVNAPVTAPENAPVTAPVNAPETVPETVAAPVTAPVEEVAPILNLVKIDAPAPVAEEKQVINIVTKPTVTFSTNHVLFDSEVLEENGIEDIPFADESLSLEPSDEMPMEFDEEL
jgi:hypothetical protein